MNDKCFVDSNILLYAHDRSTGAKHLLARTLLEKVWHSGLGVISTQILQEVCVNLRRKAGSPLSIEEVRSIVQDYLSWEVVTNTHQSILQALDIEARYKISFWDAMVIQAAENAGCAILYSEDLNDQQRFGSVQIINPLKA